MKKFFYLLISGIFIVFSTFSFSGCKNNEIEKVSRNLTCYAISAEFDDDKKEISGTEKINYVNNTGIEIDHICLHLYARAFRKDALIKPYSALNVATCFPNGLSFGDISIVNVKVNGEIKNHEIVGEDEDILKINFGFNLSKGGKIEIVIDFVFLSKISIAGLSFAKSALKIGVTSGFSTNLILGLYTKKFAIGLIFDNIKSYTIHYLFIKSFVPEKLLKF